MSANFEILILCGGEGKRLRSMISDVPKPMAPIGDKPFLDYLVRSIEKQGFKNYCFLSGYKSENITSYFKENFKDLNIRFSIEENPLGTGGAIFQAVKNSNFQKFIILNGDTFFNIDLNSLSSNWKEGTLKIALKKIVDSARYGRVDIDKNGVVTSFLEKGESQLDSASLINGGIYILDKSILDFDSNKNSFVSLENDIFPKLLSLRKINTQTFVDEFIDIGVPEDYIKAKSLIQKWLNTAKANNE